MKESIHKYLYYTSKSVKKFKDKRNTHFLEFNQRALKLQFDCHLLSQKWQKRFSYFIHLQGEVYKGCVNHLRNIASYLKIFVYFRNNQGNPLKSNLNSNHTFLKSSHSFFKPSLLNFTAFKPSFICGKSVGHKKQINVLETKRKAIGR